MSDVACLEAGAWRVAFTWQGDRYAHRIERRTADGSWQAVLVSVEGTADDDWPPSPPLTGLHVEQRPGDVRVALLVGMAGGSHWSLAVEALPEAPWLRFDCACRLKGPGNWLGSTYQAPAAGGLLLGAPPPVALVSAQGQIAIRPAPQPAAFPHTVQWSYQLAEPRLAAPR